ncbi:MAG: hypothetical protein Q9M41_02315 [Paracoccaceae bacterium]|nr:hypothetical protein [Paracoccaceae bacterium]
MPLPIAPLASIALRYGGVALASYAVARKIRQSATHQPTEDALDRVDDGLAAHRPCDRADGGAQVNASGRWRRIFRVGNNGPGIEIDATVIGRVRIRRV